MVTVLYHTFGEEELRQAAFARVKVLAQVYGDDIPWNAINQGFELGGQRISLASKAVGIFKPQQMTHGALSIKTTKPRAGRINPYADKEDADGTFVYSLQGKDPDNHHNRALRQCCESRLPIIYFHAVAPSVYKAIFPCFIEAIDISNMRCHVSVASDLSFASDSYSVRDSAVSRIERRYTFREAKVRLHQAEFRERVLDAYGRRCAMTSLPVPELLEAAHIVPDIHELGVAEVNNGICLSRIHHRAFDANLIGIDADYRIQVSDRLMEIEDGIILEGGLKALQGLALTLPGQRKNWPNRDLLNLRFDEFKKWHWD